MIELARPSKEEIDIQIEDNYQRSIADWKRFYAEKIECDSLDEDGYPTEDALELIERWHFNDAEGWFVYIRSIWWSADWGWKEKEEPHEYKENTMVHRYHVSTGGWSGNESIIRAMQDNHMMWHLNWVQSRRGGHYIFELKEIK